MPTNPAALGSAHSMRSSRSGLSHRKRSRPSCCSAGELETAWRWARRTHHGRASAVMNAIKQRIAPVTAPPITAARALGRSLLILILFIRYHAVAPESSPTADMNEKPEEKAVPISEKSSWLPSTSPAVQTTATMPDAHMADPRAASLMRERRMLFLQIADQTRKLITGMLNNN